MKPAEIAPTAIRARPATPGTAAPQVSFTRTELRILKTCRALLRSDGYRALSMYRLADAADCTRPTVYRYFADVDDVIAALCIQSLARRVEMFSRVLSFQGWPRERYSALGAVLQEVAPYHMVHESILYNPGFLQRMRPERRRLLAALENRSIETSSAIIEDGIAQGDLVLPSHLTPVQVSISMSAIALGMQFLIQRGFSLGGSNLEAPMRTWTRTTDVALDDLGWRPLSSELDYVASAYRMWREVFPDLLEKFGVNLGQG